MAKEVVKPNNPFSTKRWKEFQAPQSLQDLLQIDREYSVYKGKIDGETSFFLVGKFGEHLYAYSISKENLCQLEKLQERLKSLNCKFKQNENVNPFEGWKEGELNQSISNYEARVNHMGGRHDYCVGRFGDSCYTYPIMDRKFGHEIDWVQALGVYVHF